jgi:hypothetical protein
MNSYSMAAAGLGCILVISAATSACGADPDGRHDGRRTITTTATATAEAAPDRARFIVEVETRDPVAERCAQRNSKLSDAAMEALKRIAKKSGTIATDQYSMTPTYSTQNDGGVRRQVLDGYLARHRVRVVTSDLDSIGRLLDAAVGAGATGAGSVEFYIEDPDSLRRKALLEAGARAKKDAQIMAKSLGVELGKLLSAGQAGGGVIVPRPFARAEGVHPMASAVTQTPVEPGDVKISTSVTVVFEVK